jgi:predicted nucleotidyltransferase
LYLKTIEHTRDFLDAFILWASEQADVQGIALVGFYARGTAGNGSDIDLVILTDQPPKYLENILWIEQFGLVEKHQTEDYGKLTSLRVWYQHGIEVEYGITKGEPPTWRNLSHYLSQSFAAIRMSAFYFFLLIATRAFLLVRLQQLIIKDLHIALQPLDYLLTVKRLHSSFSFLLPGGVTVLQVEVLYS